MEDLFHDIRKHAGAAGGKYLQENVVLAAVEEILTAQSMPRTPAVYMGALMMSLQAEGNTEPAVLAGVLTLLDRTLSLVPRAVLSSKAARISTALVSVASQHAEHPPVLKGVLDCVVHVLGVLGGASSGAAPTADALKLFRWLLEFVTHPSPKVRARGQRACCAALEASRALSAAASRFVETRLASAVAKDVQPALHVLNFLRPALGSFEPAPLASTTQALLRLPSLGHPLLTRSTAELLASACSHSEPPLPSSVLLAIIDQLLRHAGSETRPRKTAAHANADDGVLRACAAAATALAPLDAAACHTRLPGLCTAALEGLWRQQAEGGEAEGGGGSADALTAAELRELIDSCVTPAMDPAQASALAAALRDGLTPRYMPLWEGVLEACGALFRGLGAAAHPPCGELLTAMSAMYSVKTLGSARPALLASLGLAAKAVGPETFIGVLPIKVSTTAGAEDTSWLLSVLRGHVGNASLAHFGSYFLPLTRWLAERGAALREEGRQVEARNLMNLHEQVWALLPGYCSCARDVADALPSVAKPMGVAINEMPEVRPHVLQSLTLLVMTARSRKAAPDAAAIAAAAAKGAPVESALTPDAQAAIATVGRFGKNFLPILFNVHQAEAPERRPAIQEAARAVASATPDATLAELFKTVMRRLLEPYATEQPSGKAATPANSLETQRGLLDLLVALSPALGEAQVEMLLRAVRPMLLSTDLLLQKKAYKVVAELAAHHATWVRTQLSTLSDAMGEALPACAPACKGKRIGCLQAVAAALPPAQLTELLPSLLGEVVLATKEVNVKTRAAAFDFLVRLAETAERRAAGGAEAKAEAVRGIFVMVTAGLAGNTPHMMAATLSALGRLTFGFRDRPAMLPTCLQLLSTVMALLEHRAHEVVKAVLSFIKVGLSALPSDAVAPLLPRLVPPMLAWCSNKHPHLKTQVRYLMERLVKRFGHDEMAKVTPEAHHRLLAHLRKQKNYAHNKAARAGAPCARRGRA